jgi:pyridoxal phosphate enzyme (YggS family)
VNNVGARLAEVRDRIAHAAREAGRDPNDVQLVAVSKAASVGLVRDAIAAGQRDFGENRAQELAAKADAITDAALQWHFIGRLQRNKVKAIAGVVSLWQSVDRLELGELIARHAPGARVLVQIRLGGEDTKGGCDPAEADALSAGLTGLGLAVEGLMTVPPHHEDPRPYFATLRELAARLGLQTLSMGMSGDYETAIAEGATLVRVGTAVFGARPPATRP